MPKLFENLWVKLAALILASLLWIHVATNKVYQEEVTLAVTQVDISSKLLLTEPPPESVTVTVSATGKKLLRSDWKRGGLRLMINRNSPGKLKAAITLDNLTLVQKEKIELVKVVSPREWDIACDRKVEKKLPMKSRVNVHPADGYAVKGNDSISPPTVSVVGPASLLNGLSFLETIEKTLEGVRNDLTIRAPVQSPGIYGTSIKQDSVDITVHIVPIKSRLFPNIAVRLINAPTDNTADVFPPKIELRIGGEPQAIDTLSSRRIVAVADYSQMGENDFAPVKVTLPPYFYILYLSADSVKIVPQTPD